MKKIDISTNKVLKLQNVLIAEVDINKESVDSLDIVVQKMNTFISTHGAVQIGPLIQYTNVCINETGEMNLKTSFMLQCNNYIHDVDKEYSMNSVMRVKNCLYARYVGPNKNIKFAYDKLGVYAFENDIELDGCNYTVYVNQNEEDETMIADIFMPVKE